MYLGKSFSKLSVIFYGDPKVTFKLILPLSFLIKCSLTKNWCELLPDSSNHRELLLDSYNCPELLPDSYFKASPSFQILF